MVYSVPMRGGAKCLAMLFGLMRGSAGAGANEGGCVEGFEDLPLMPGLAVDESAEVLFDKPTGRIVEATAGGEVAAADIRSFYGATLPELGWQPLPPRAGTAMLRFERREQPLQIELRDDRRMRRVGVCPQPPRPRTAAPHPPR